jgi:hypothetical protein
MNIYNSLYHNTLLRKIEKVRDEHTRIINIMFGKVIGDQVKYMTGFARQLEFILGDDDYKITPGGNYITIYSKGKFVHPDYKYTREIASINLPANAISFKRKGIEGTHLIPNKPAHAHYSQFTKIIKFGRELTPEKAARYIIRFSTQ